MTAELVRGQNHPLPGGRLEILVSAGTPVIAGATLNNERGRMRDARWCAHPASPRLPGVEVPRQAAAEHRLTVDPAALPQDVHRVNVLLALPEGPGGPARFAGLPAPFLAVTGPDGTVLVSCTVLGLGDESAVVALELYRRQGAWKIRAVGQGYAAELAALLADQGLPDGRRVTKAAMAAVAVGRNRSSAAAARRGRGREPGRRPGPDFRRSVRRRLHRAGRARRRRPPPSAPCPRSP